MHNKDIRDYAKSHDIKLWQIANELHINDGNFSRKLRVELSDEKKAVIYTIIDDLSQREGV